MRTYEEQQLEALRAIVPEFDERERNCPFVSHVRTMVHQGMTVEEALTRMVVALSKSLEIQKEYSARLLNVGLPPVFIYKETE